MIAVAMVTNPTSVVPDQAFPVTSDGASAELFLLAAAAILTLIVLVVFGAVLFRQARSDSDGNVPTSEDDRNAL